MKFTCSKYFSNILECRMCKNKAVKSAEAKDPMCSCHQRIIQANLSYLILTVFSDFSKNRISLKSQMSFYDLNIYSWQNWTWDCLSVDYCIRSLRNILKLVYSCLQFYRLVKKWIYVEIIRGNVITFLKQKWRH